MRPASSRLPQPMLVWHREPILDSRRQTDAPPGRFASSPIFVRHNREGRSASHHHHLHHRPAQQGILPLLGCALLTHRTEEVRQVKAGKDDDAGGSGKGMSTQNRTWSTQILSNSRPRTQHVWRTRVRRTQRTKRRETHQHRTQHACPKQAVRRDGGGRGRPAAGPPVYATVAAMGMAPSSLPCTSCSAPWRTGPQA
jgi:hypothetical protein